MDTFDQTKNDMTTLTHEDVDTKSVLLIAGSNSPYSINRKVIEYTAGLFKKNKTTVFDLRDYPLPIFSIEIEEIDNRIREAVVLLEDELQKG